MRKEFVEEKVIKDLNRKSTKVFKMLPKVLIKFREEFPIESKSESESDEELNDGKYLKNVRTARGIDDKKMEADVFDI